MAKFYCTACTTNTHHEPVEGAEDLLGECNECGEYHQWEDLNVIPEARSPIAAGIR